MIVLIMIISIRYLIYLMIMGLSVSGSPWQHLQLVRRCRYCMFRRLSVSVVCGYPQKQWGGLSFLASRWSVNQFGVSLFISVLNKWLDFPFWSWPISKLGFLYPHAFFFLVSAYFQCCCKQPSFRSFCETEPNQMLWAVPHFIFMWVLQELQLFDPSQGCIGRSGTFMLAQRGAGELSRVCPTSHPRDPIKG